VTVTPSGVAMVLGHRRRPCWREPAV